MLLESHEGVAAADYQVNTALELKVGDEAHVDHIKITADGAGAVHLSTLMASIGARARFNEFLFTTGGAVVRNQPFVRSDGGEDRRRHPQPRRCGPSARRYDDHRRSRVGECTSREVFVGALIPGVFQGKIVARPRAQETDARMATHALLLSTAEADHKPELEIFADDVQCGAPPRRISMRICCST